MSATKQWRCDTCGRDASFRAEFNEAPCQIPNTAPGDCKGTIRVISELDSRVERVAVHMNQPALRWHWIAEEIEIYEDAGLIVANPDDQETIDRVGYAIHVALRSGLQQADSLARVALTALKGS